MKGSSHSKSRVLVCSCFLQSERGVVSSASSRLSFQQPWVCISSFHFLSHSLPFISVDSFYLVFVIVLLKLYLYKMDIRYLTRLYAQEACYWWQEEIVEEEAKVSPSLSICLFYLTILRCQPLLLLQIIVH